MYKLQTKTYLYFWSAAAITVLIGYTLFTKIDNSTLSINVHDSYFVISHLDFNILIAYTLTFIGLIYYIHAVFNIPLYKYLTITHTLTTLSCVILYFLSLFFEVGTKKEFPLFDDSNSVDYFLAIISSIILLAQLLLIFNSIISSIKRFTQKTKL